MWYLTHYTVQKFGVSKILFLGNEICKDTINCSEWQQESWKKKQFPQRILNSTDFNIYNNQKCFLSTNLAYRISEGSCDTKDGSNGCWKFSFASQEKKITFNTLK